MKKISLKTGLNTESFGAKNMHQEFNKYKDIGLNHNQTFSKNYEKFVKTSRETFCKAFTVLRTDQTNPFIFQPS